MIEKINQSPDSDANESYETIITEAYNKTHPLTGKRFRCDQFKIKAWMTDPILKSIATKDKTYVEYRKSTRLSTKYFELKEKLSEMNTNIDKDITDSKQKYYTERINTYQNDAKNTWGVIREMLNKTNVKTTFPPFFLLDNKKMNDKTEIANEFNKLFV